MSAKNFQLPSSTSHVNPFFILVFEMPVPRPSDGLRVIALVLLSTAIFIFSVSSIVKGFNDESNDCNKVNSIKPGDITVVLVDGVTISFLHGGCFGWI